MGNRPGTNPSQPRLSLWFLVLLVVVLIVPSVAEAVITTGAQMTAARAYQASTLLPSGKILFTGGYGNGYLNSSEIYDPFRNTFSPASAMASSRHYHSATPLPNGKILIAGGSIDGSEYFTTTELYDPLTDTFQMGPTMSAPRNSHTATLLPNGKVLIAGGFNGTSTQATAEIYDPASNTFTATTTTMQHARHSHTATVLADGQVLLAGGYAGSGALNTAEIFDPATGIFSPAGSMSVARFYHTATLLRDGSVLVAGGSSDSAILNSAERYVPGTNSFSSAGNLAAARYFHTATVLPSGKVLVVGGRNGNSFLNSTELYDPGTSTFSSSSGSMLTGRYTHTAILLPSGKVLIAGGSNVSGSLRSTELYDGASGSFSTINPLSAPRTNHISVPLTDGRVLIAGGGTGGEATASAELFDPASGTTTPTGSMAVPRRAFTGVLLPTGKILVAGGNNGTGTVASAELFDPASGTFSPLPAMAAAREGHSATVLANGRVLIAGGWNGAQAADSAEIFDPARMSFLPTGSMTAARTSHSATLLAGGKVLVTGGRNSVALRTAELYDPASGTFSATGSLSTTRHGHSATALPSGKIIVIGGSDGTSPLASTELFDPTTGMFSAAATMATERQIHASALLQSGKVLVAGGEGTTGTLASAEVFDPMANSFIATAPMGSPRKAPSALLLRTGKVLVTGGEDLAPLSSVELFDQDLGISEVLRPVVTAVNPVPGAPSKIVASGSAFTGMMEGSTGATNNATTSFPLLQLQEIYSNITSFIRPDGAAPWSDTSFTSASTYGLPMGHYRTRIVKSAVPSEERIIRLAPVKTVGSTALAFGETGVNHSATPQPVTLGNTGTADLLITEVALTGADAGMFSVTPAPGCGIGSYLGQNGLCNISIGFNPTSTGEKQATLSLATNDPDNPFAAVTLSGSGIPIYFVLDTLAGAGGLVSLSTGSTCRGSCTENILEGTPVQLTASPDPTFLFGGWSGCDTVAGAVCTVTMTSAKSVGATFIETFPLTMNLAGSASGTISISTGDTCSAYPCTKTFASPTVVVLTPSSGPTSTFTGWTGCDSVNGNACTVTMTAAKNVTATFEASYQLMLTIGGSGTGSVSLAPGGTCTQNCTQSYVNGTTVVLTASAGEGFSFAGWSGCESPNGAICTVTMTAAKNVTATFSSAQTLTIEMQGGSGSVSASPGSTCGANCTQTYGPGTVVQLTATPGANATFSSWTGCDSVEGAVCTVTMNASRTVTASFVSSYQLSLTMAGIGSGSVNFSTGGSCTGACIRTITSGTVLTLTAVPDTTSAFESWLGCDDTNGTECTITMTGGRIVTASFTFPISVSGRMYGTIPAAYESAGHLEKIKMRTVDLVGDVDLNRTVSVTLAGGYDSSFLTVVGQTNIVGKVTVSSGTATLEGIVIR